MKTELDIIAIAKKPKAVYKRKAAIEQTISGPEGKIVWRVAGMKAISTESLMLYTNAKMNKSGIEVDCEGFRLVWESAPATLEFHRNASTADEPMTRQ